MAGRRPVRGLDLAIVAAAVLALLCPAASAQPVRPPAPGSQPAPVAATGQISGVVRSAADDVPLGRARVTAVADDRPEPRVTISGADGKYALTDLPAGSYTVSVTRTGYAPQTHASGRGSAATPIVVASAQQIGGVNFALVPGNSIPGRILDEDGTPFAGAIVEALVARTENGTSRLLSVASAQTDDRGEFRLFGLAPGPYYVSAGDPAFRAVSTPRGVVRYSPTYFPGTAFADQARPVTLTSGGAAPRVEFRLQLVPPARIAGQLLTSDGRPLLGAVVTMSPREGRGVPMVPPEDPQLLPDGVFSFGQVFPGSYEILARGQTDRTGIALFAVYSLQVLGNDVSDIRMMLQPGAVLDGSIIVESRHGTKPPALAVVRVRAPFVDGNNFGDALTGTPKPDGTFALRGLMAGSHQLVVDGLPAPWVLKSVLYRGTDITDRQFDVAGHEVLRDVRVTITDASSAVTGLVRNAKSQPVANTGVLVFPSAALFWLRTNRRMRIAYTDGEGRFALAGLPAGQYLAVASPAADESDLGRPDRLEAWQRLATPFVLAADDGRASLTLSLVPQPPAVIVAR